jgi:hypothetical protein
MFCFTRFAIVISVRNNSLALSLSIVLNRTKIHDQVIKTRHKSKVSKTEKKGTEKRIVINSLIDSIYFLAIERKN